MPTRVAWLITSISHVTFLLIHARIKLVFFYKSPTAESYSACCPLKPPHPSLLCHYWTISHPLFINPLRFSLQSEKLSKKTWYTFSGLVGRNVPTVNANSTAEAPRETEKTSEPWQFPRKPPCWFSRSIWTMIQFVTVPEINPWVPHMSLLHECYFSDQWPLAGGRGDGTTTQKTFPAISNYCYVFSLVFRLQVPNSTE